MKKILALGMLGLMIVAAFALGTSATFRDYRAQRSTHIAVVTDDNELIDLTPVQPYAYINDGGQLVIDFSENNPNWPGHNDPDWSDKNGIPIRGIGLSPQSRYNFDHVFNVSNHLWEGKVILVRIISSDAGKVSFYDPYENMRSTNTGSTPYNSDTSAGDVCFYLAPGEALGVGMELVAPNTLGSYDVDITIMAWPADNAPIECTAPYPEGG
ncbi:DUF1102 domain-containing protein [Thermococcus sp. GR6]|uniref:DUF1102 domain-containing protein n=1 Tax=Thermococcus sp. GR6 TaxID=1638256 RepID=UPI00142F6106|nr:DUF1102 domain-containing protein [Thermococcus sp. GR6]NJE42844.1 DUF1102 domain-containing protein [Thermococcus sp. GR6]